MSADHRIRLHGPWQCEWVFAAATPRPPSLKIRFPLSDATPIIHWLETISGGSNSTASMETGKLELVRRFNWPHPVADGESVILAVTSNGTWSAGFLNGYSLDLDSAGDILSLPMNSHLQPHNEVRLQLQLATGTPLGSLVIQGAELVIADASRGGTVNDRGGR